LRWIRLQLKKLRDALDGYINKARKVSGKRSTSRKVGSAVDLKARRHRSEEAVVLQQLRSALAIIQEHEPARITTVGGECSVSMAPFSYLINKHGADLAILLGRLPP